MYFFEVLSHSKIMLADHAEQNPYEEQDAELDEYTKTPDELQEELMDTEMNFTTLNSGAEGSSPTETETAAISPPAPPEPQATYPDEEV